MAESEAGIVDNKEDIKPPSREERIRKYLEEKKQFSIRKIICKCSSIKFTYKLRRPIAVAKRLERRAKQRAFRKMTPDEQENYRQNGNHRTKRWAHTTIGGLKKHFYNLRTVTSSSVCKGKLFNITDKFKDNTGNEGKGSWTADYSPSVIDTVTGQFWPGATADKSETREQKNLKKKKCQRGTGPRLKDKYIPEVYPKWIIYNDYIYIVRDHVMERENAKRKEVAEPESDVKDYEVKLRSAIDGLDQKSASGRARSFATLQTTLSLHLQPDIVTNNRATIADALVRALKKGHSDEQLAAVRLAPALCIQLGEKYCQEFVSSIKPAFINIIKDKAIDTKIRAECCQSLAAVSVLSSADMLEIIELMRTCETIFSADYSKGSCYTRESATAESMLRSAALNAWSLLLAGCSPADVHLLLIGKSSALSLCLLQLTELLKAPAVKLRTAAGIGLSVAYELGLQYSEEFGRDELNTVIAEVEQMKSSKFRFKKDCKIQRGIFRKVLKSLEEHRAPVERVHLGEETLVVDSWSSHVLYHRLAAALGSGLLVASRTSLLRSALRMPPLVCQDRPHKRDKQEKHRHYANESKARSISRNKNRNKRHDDFDL